MVFPISVRLINKDSGEVLASNVLNDFSPKALPDRQKLFRWVDLLCDFYVSYPSDDLLIEITRHHYPDELSLF